MTTYNNYSYNFGWGYVVISAEKDFTNGKKTKQDFMQKFLDNILLMTPRLINTEINKF